MSRRVTLKLGFQGHIRDVTVTIPDDEPTPWDWGTRLEVVGKPAARLDGPVKTTGSARYTYDVEPAGMLYGAVLRSPHPHARISSIDLTGAGRHPGVRAVLEMDDPVARFAGQEVAAVAALTPDIANDALRLIRVEYEPLPFVVDLGAAMAPGAPTVFANRPNVEAPKVNSRGDCARGLAGAAVVHEAVYRTPVQTHVSLEVHGAVATWEGDKLTVWTSTQGIFTVRDDLAAYFKLPRENVRVISDYIGGGFGSKFGAGPEVITAARLAKMAGAPVKLMLTRQAEHLATGNRPNSIQRVRLGVDRTGALTALDLVQHGSGGIGGGSGSAAPFLELYRCPNVRTEECNVFMNTGPSSPMRAPGWPQGCFALELALDEAARKLNLDRLDLRRRNNDNPVRALEFDLGAKAFEWNARSRAKRAAGPIRRGIGVASAAWRASGRPGPEALVIARRDGLVEVRVGTQDIGTGTRTVLAMVAAEELGIGLKHVACEIGDTRFPYSVPSGGSQTAPSNTPAVRRAAARLRRKLCAIAAPMLGAKPRELEVRDETIRVRSDHARKVAFNDVCKRIPADSLSAHDERVMNYGGFRNEQAGCQFVEVEVDAETGVVRVTEVVAVHDAGRILDPLTAQSQVHGGILMGVGYALFEQRRMDPELGIMVNPTMDDYKLVGPMDTPEIKTLFVEVSNGINNTGVLGLGEAVHVATAAAIACAVYDAVGVPIRSLPLTPDRVLAATQVRL